MINATAGDDVITVTNDGGLVTVSGLAAKVTISGFEANDRIVINGLGGDDVIQASGLTGMQLTANGGDGDDIIVGSPGNDVLTGGAGDDVLIGNGGQDILDGGSGNNVVINAAFAPLANSGGARRRAMFRTPQGPPCWVSSWRRASSPRPLPTAGRLLAPNRGAPPAAAGAPHRLTQPCRLENAK